MPCAAAVDSKSERMPMYQIRVRSSVMVSVVIAVAMAMAMQIVKLIIG